MTDSWVPHQSDDGFTLVELLVVMSLIMILGTLALPQYRHSVLYAREAVLKEDLFRSVPGLETSSLESPIPPLARRPPCAIRRGRSPAAAPRG